MQKFSVIEELCADLLNNPCMHRQETIDDLCIAASMVRSDMGFISDNWFECDGITAARFIKERVAFCNVETQEIVYRLLIEMTSEITH